LSTVGAILLQKHVANSDINF